jgi:aspartate carbamoyltransferase catalytic subunit
MKDNHRLIAEIGLDAFLEQQARRIAFLETALKHHANGRNKGTFCLAAALLSIDSLQKALSLTGQGENLRDTLKQLADAEGQELILRKDKSSLRGVV